MKSFAAREAVAFSAAAIAHGIAASMSAASPNLAGTTTANNKKAKQSKSASHATTTTPKPTK